MREDANAGRTFTTATTEPDAGVEATRARRVGPGTLAVGLALVVGLGGWMAVRVRSAVATQKAVAAQGAEVARAAAETAARPATVRTVRGAPETWTPRVAFDGTLAPVREADLGFKAGGRIGSIRVKVGDVVREGALLASLDAAEASAQATAADAQVRAAQAQLALATDAHQRTDALVRGGGAPAATGVQTEHQRALAAAQLDAARAQAALARVALTNHALTAPFGGIVTKVPQGPGAVVGAGVPQFHVSDLSTLRLVGTVGADDAALVRAGAEIEIAAEGRTVVGTVSSVLASVDPATRRVPVEATVANPAAEGGTSPLRAGTFVRASVRGGAPIPVLRLPHEALRPGSQDEVMIVRGDVLAARRATFVVAPDGALLVRAGLGPDEEVVLGPSPEAKDGDHVSRGGK